MGDDAWDFGVGCDTGQGSPEFEGYATIGGIVEGLRMLNVSNEVDRSEAVDRDELAEQIEQALAPMLGCSFPVGETEADGTVRIDRRGEAKLTRGLKSRMCNLFGLELVPGWSVLAWLNAGSVLVLVLCSNGTERALCDPRCWVSAHGQNQATFNGVEIPPSPPLREYSDCESIAEVKRVARSRGWRLDDAGFLWKLDIGALEYRIPDSDLINPTNAVLRFERGERARSPEYAQAIIGVERKTDAAIMVNNIPTACTELSNPDYGILVPPSNTAMARLNAYGTHPTPVSEVLAQKGGADALTRVVACARVREQAQAGGVDCDEARSMAERRVRLELALVRRLERDLGMLRDLGPGFCRTANDRREAPSERV